MRLATVLVLVAGCDRVFGLEPRDAGTDVAIDAEVGVCPALPYDPARYLAVSNTPGLSWTDARARCARLAMDLAVLDRGDGEELAAQSTGGKLPFWLGVAYGDSWSAIDDCAPSLSWAAGEPVASEPGYCALVTANGLVAERCSATQWQGLSINALCETPRASDACLELQANSQYMVASTTQIFQEAGLALCEQLGMHLVEINSSAELAHIRQTVAPAISRFWIAGAYTGATWTSATMCPQVFHWKTFEPNTSSAYLVCALHDAGGESAFCMNEDAATICEQNTPP